MLLAMTAKRPDPSPASPAPISIALGKRVKQCRHAADKSQETLAFEAHVDRTYISSIERGIANPSVETLANICHCLGSRSPNCSRRWTAYRSHRPAGGGPTRRHRRRSSAAGCGEGA